MISCVLLIDKVAGPTSHDVVQGLRRVLGVRKIGHAGTLDPFATGLLVCCAGPTTRLASYLADSDKEYSGRVRLGIATDTLDPTGKTVERLPVPADWQQRLAAATAGLTGNIEQTPPMTSAVRVGGRRLYKLARAGIEVERQPRPVRIERFVARPLGPEEIAIEVRCSKGTYIRVLAAELGRALGTCALLEELRRTRIGGLEVEQAVRSDELAALGREEILRVAAVSPSAALGHWAAVTLDGAAAAAVRQGVAPTPRSVTAAAPIMAGERVRLLDEAGRLLALAEMLVDLPAVGGDVASGESSPAAEPAVVRFLRVLGG